MCVWYRYRSRWYDCPWIHPLHVKARASGKWTKRPLRSSWESTVHNGWTRGSITQTEQSGGGATPKRKLASYSCKKGPCAGGTKRIWRTTMSAYMTFWGDNTLRIVKSTVLKQLKIKSSTTQFEAAADNDNEDQNMILGEKPSLFHLLKMRKLREASMIHKLQADDTPRSLW